MDSEYIEDVASSLVREYLSRKGLRLTLQRMEEECPRGKHCINNRLELVKCLHLEKLIKRNKDLPNPHRSMIEVITRNLLEKAESKFGNLEYFTRQIASTDGNENKVMPQYSCSSLGRPRSKTRSGNAKSITSGELVLEDEFEQESETILGRGKGGLMEKETAEEEERGHRSRPRSTKSRGLAGPVSSSSGDSKARNDRFKRPMADFDSGPLLTNHVPPGKSEVFFTDSSSDDARDRIRPGPELDQDPFEGLLAGQEGHRPRTSRKKSDDEALVDQLEYKVSESSISTDQRPTRQSMTKDSRWSSAHRAGDINLADVDDIENEVQKVAVTQPRIPMQGSFGSGFSVDSKPIDEQTAIALKSLIFGSALQNFNNEWRYQSFTSCDLPKLLYGIVQKKGGPCGVLAAVQASLLQCLLFADDKKPTLSNLSPSRTQRSEALAKALALILWRAGSRKRAIVALPSMRPHFPATPKFKNDQLTETLILSTLSRREDLVTFLKQNISQFEMDGTSGVVLTLYSAILSRGIAGVRSDMDEPMGQLMGAHGYCSQDMVNLLVVGRAVSNTFNDIMELDSGEGKVTILKGVPCRSEVGFLSLFEHYKSCRVGTYLKTPKFPIWIVCSESHFSVLFCLKKELLSDWKAERRFDLYYFDGLGKQEKEIKLTIDTTSRYFKAPDDEDLVPPLEHCIRTKWCDAEVDWNGTEPIL